MKDMRVFIFLIYIILPIALLSQGNPKLTYSIPLTLFTKQVNSFLPVYTGDELWKDGDVKLLAGPRYNSIGLVNGASEDARFNNPGAMAQRWSILYISDGGNHCIRTLNPSNGEVGTFVGSGSAGYANGSGSSAQFSNPSGIAFDNAGNLYVSDRGNHVIRKVNSSGSVTLFAGTSGSSGYADGTGTLAKFSSPAGIAVDSYGNVFVADEGNRRIRKITPGGVVSTFAGDGTTTSADGIGTSASFYGMKGLARDNNNNLYLAEYNRGKIRKITPAGEVTTLAGSGTAGNMDGVGAAVQFYFPIAISASPSGNVYVTQLDHRIRKITPSGEVVTIAGTGGSGRLDGPPEQATFNEPSGIFAWYNDELFIGDTKNHSIRRIGKNDSYTVDPYLPEGLSIDRKTGIISGEAYFVEPFREYIVTAHARYAKNNAVIRFTVQEPDPITSLAPDLSQNRNFVVETIVRHSGITSLDQLSRISGVDRANRTIRYLDGLGRSQQVVQWQGSPDKKDIVQYIEHDSFGRESTHYLPYTDRIEDNGRFKNLANAGTLSFYSSYAIEDVVRTNYPYSKTVFENSPLNRVLEQGAPGYIWQPTSSREQYEGRTIVSDYGTNETNDVRLWIVTSGGAIGTSYYQPGKLYKNVIKDENWTSGKAGTVEEFRDFSNKVVLKRVWNTDAQTQQDYALNTYYVYDDFGNLRYVIPPGYNANTMDTSSTDFKELVYAYTYDGRKRLIEKKIPGKGWGWIVYDQRDRPVLTQDAVQRDNNRWSYIKYDMLGRVTETGIHTSTYADRIAVQTAVDSFWENTQTFGERRLDSVYTNQMFPMGNLQPLVVNYYDDYGFEGAYKLPYNGTGYSTRTKTLPTGTKVYRDDGTLPLLTVNYYDNRARLIQTASQNHLGGTDYVTNAYSFTGELLTSKREHKPTMSGAVTTIATRNEYDHVGRLLTVKHKVNTQDEVILATNEYNEVGQLKKRSLGREGMGNNFITEANYFYNERGWLYMQEYANFFYTYLNYEWGDIPQFNGNISTQESYHYNSNGNRFSYEYDALNRLIRGDDVYHEGKGEQVAYDDRGNITMLIRDEGTPISYQYMGNRLTQVSGGIVGTYAYDKNGNAIKDRTGMDFTYNHLNLPKTASKTGVSVHYLYDALGTKLSRISSQQGQRDYIGGIEYDGTGSIDIIHTGEGIAYSNRDGTYTYHYNLTDHLGNVRAVIYRNPTTQNTEVLQQTDYYPFGKQYRDPGYLTGNNQYLYNGKELQDDLAMGTQTFGGSYTLEGQYDYGARFYDTELGRWNVADPMAEATLSISPYAYVGNNPIFYNDPTGMVANPFIRNNSNGSVRWIASETKIPTGWSVIPESLLSDQMKSIDSKLEWYADQVKTDYKKQAGALFMGYPTEEITKRTLDKASAKYLASEMWMHSDPLMGRVLGVRPSFGLEDANWIIDIGVGGIHGGLKYFASRKATGLIANSLDDVVEGGYSTIYRAVSQAEVDDIAEFGLRMKSGGGYELGKLFAPTFEEAAQFGKYNFGLDGIPNTIMKVRVPNSVLNGAYRFTPDGMNAISIPANQLNLLKATPLNYSPWLR